MRHWNNNKYGIPLSFQKRFYPTYEALKRNPSIVKLDNVEEFLPYLWGIET